MEKKNKTISNKSKVLSIISFAIYCILIIAIMNYTSVEWYYAPIILTSIIAFFVGVKMIFNIISK